MAIDTAILNSSFNVNTINIIGIPTESKVFNEFDEFGLLIGSERLSGENNAAYKARLLDTFAHRANSTYSGMINGITRELNLQLFKPFRIRPVKSGNTFLGENPIVIFNGPYVELWRDKINGVLELEIDRFNQSGPAYTIGELFAYINANSTYFICDGLVTTYSDYKSMTILNQSNEQLVASEAVQPSVSFTLDNPGVDSGAIILNKTFFSDSINFATRVNSFANVVSPGQYYVDPYTGDVHVFDVSFNSTVRYNYIKYNSFNVVASPVVIHSVNSENFKRQMFKQILGDDGKYYHGITNEFGSFLINELLSVFPLYWGE